MRIFFSFWTAMEAVDFFLIDLNIIFHFSAAKASTFKKRPGAIDGAARRKVFAGVIGVVIWVGLMGTVVVLVGIKKRCSRRGEY